MLTCPLSTKAEPKFLRRRFSEKIPSQGKKAILQKCYLTISTHTGREGEGERESTTISSLPQCPRTMPGLGHYGVCKTVVRLPKEVLLLPLAEATITSCATGTSFWPVMYCQKGGSASPKKNQRGHPICTTL